MQHPGKAPPPNQPKLAFGDQPPRHGAADGITHPYSSKASTKLGQIFDRRSAPAPFHLPWKNNRIFPIVGPEQKEGSTDDFKPTRTQHSNSVDNGVFIDGSYFQTKEALTSAKTRLGKVLSQMNILKTLQTQKNSVSSISEAVDHRNNGSVSIPWPLNRTERELQRIPGAAMESEVESREERGRSREDIIRQSYTGSAMSFKHHHPYQPKEGAHMSSLDSDDDQDQSPFDSDGESQTNTQLDDTEIESKTETDSEMETDQETDTERTSETENESGQEAAKESNSEEGSSGKESIKSVRSSHSGQNTTIFESTKSRDDMEEGDSEGYSKKTMSSMSRSYSPERRRNSSFHSLSNFSIADSSVAREINKLSPIDENEEGEVTPERSGSPDNSSSSSDGARNLKDDREDEDSNSDAVETVAAS